MLKVVSVLKSGNPYKNFLKPGTQREHFAAFETDLQIYHTLNYIYLSNLVIIIVIITFIHLIIIITATT